MLFKNRSLWEFLEPSFFNVTIFTYIIMEVSERLPPCQDRYFFLYYQHDEETLGSLYHVCTYYIK